MGGTGALVQGLVNLIEGQGSRCDAVATSIGNYCRGRIARGGRLGFGEVIRSRHCCREFGRGWTYKKLLAEAPRKRWTDRRFDRFATP